MNDPTIQRLLRNSSLAIRPFARALALGLVFSALTISSLFGIGGVDTAPAPSAPSETHFAQPKETRLDNGLRVIVVERPDLPLLAAEVVFQKGAESDAADLAGTASMTGALLTKGTDSMSAPQIAEKIESLGGEISSGAGWDESTAIIVVMSDKANAALAVLADVVLHPTFKQEEVDRLKKQRLDGLRVSMQQPGSIASFVSERIVFGDGEYGHPAGGTIESLEKMKRDDIVKFYQNGYAPGNAALILVGDVTLEQGTAYAQKFLGDWKAGTETPKRAANDQTNWQAENVVIDMPQAGQAAVAVSKPAIRRESPDYYAGLVTNAALGNGFVSRLNREIRIKRGLSYGARSLLDARRDVGPFDASAQTKNESAAEVAKLLMSELKRLVTEPVQGDELRSRQAVLTGNYARNLETNEGFAGTLGSLAAYNLPLERINQFIPRINAVTTKDVTDFASKYLSPPPSLIIAGKAPAFLDALRKDFPDVKVIPQANLDLNKASLTK